MTRLRSFAMALAVTTLVLPVIVKAETANGLITRFGCHNIDDVCWVTVQGFTASTFCNHSDEIRWHANTSYGQRWYATIVAAHAAGKRVALQISETVCGPNGYPTFVYGNVAD